MGYYQIRKKAYAGMLLFLLQAGFILYLALTGIYDLIDFVRLETDFRPPRSTSFMVLWPWR